MSKLQNSKTQIFVDYLPAELKENKDWRIVYYVKNPFTEKLAIKRARVKNLKSITERRKLAKRMILEINKRLENGWNPFYNNKGVKEFTKLETVLDIFLKRTKVEFIDNNLRMDTFKTYKSQISVLKKYLIETEQKNIMTYKFDSEFIGSYLDDVRYNKGLSARTRDNYLGFLGTLSRFMLSKKYITANPTEHFSKINKKDKKRTLISKSAKKEIFEYLEKNNKEYLTLCLTAYYCFIRRTELTKLHVSDVNIKNQTIFISSEDSKNRKGKLVTIPNQLINVLIDHISKAKKTDYLFSIENFSSGPKQCYPDKITKKWKRLKNTLKIKDKIDWYSLKDTGITDLLEAGVPLISVRNQARHHSSNQTDAYTPLSMKKADENVINAKVKF